MSKYTTELRFICENAVGLSENQGYSKVDDIIQQAIPKVFDFDFPIFDEEYRNVLCTKFLRHFYTREICCETVGRWKLFLEDKLNLIMPYYNKLYESSRLEFNPLRDVDYYTEHKGEGEVLSGKETSGTSKTEGEHTKQENGTRNESGSYNDYTAHTGTISDNGSKNNTRTENKNEGNSTRTIDRYSDTPQGGIEGLLGIDSTGDHIADNTYLTNARIVDVNGSTTSTDSSTVDNGTENNTRTFNNNDNGSGTSSGETITASTGSANDEVNSEFSNTEHGNSRNTEEYVNHVYGKTAGVSYSKMIEEYRKTLINIDLKVIKECEPLFMTIW